MMMVRLRALFKHDDNCLLTVTGHRTDPTDPTTSEIDHLNLS